LIDAQSRADRGRTVQVVDDPCGNRLYRNRHDWTFEDVTAKAGVGGAGYNIGVAAGDYDNDGFADLFVTGVKGNTLFHNRGDGTFEDVTRAAGLESHDWAVAAAWIDYDNDGRLDLFVVNYVKWDPAAERFCGDAARGIRTYCHPRFYEPLPNRLYHNRRLARSTPVSTIMFSKTYGFCAVTRCDAQRAIRIPPGKYQTILSAVGTPESARTTLPCKRRRNPRCGIRSFYLDTVEVCSSSLHRPTIESTG
jgi:hypothetical protein